MRTCFSYHESGAQHDRNDAEFTVDAWHLVACGLLRFYGVAFHGISNGYALLHVPLPPCQPVLAFSENHHPHHMPKRPCYFNIFYVMFVNCRCRSYNIVLVSEHVSIILLHTSTSAFASHSYLSSHSYIYI